MQECEKLDMLVVVHAGVDLGVEPPVHCTPEQMRHALQYVSGKKLIAAHLGGYLMWDDVEKYLLDTDVVFDVSMISRYISPEQCKRIIEEHGADEKLYTAATAHGKDSEMRTISLKNLNSRLRKWSL